MQRTHRFVNSLGCAETLTAVAVSAFSVGGINPLSIIIAAVAIAIPPLAAPVCPIDAMGATTGVSGRVRCSACCSAASVLGSPAPCEMIAPMSAAVYPSSRLACATAPSMANAMASHDPLDCGGLVRLLRWPLRMASEATNRLAEPASTAMARPPRSAACCDVSITTDDAPSPPTTPAEFGSWGRELVAIESAILEIGKSLR